MFQLIEPSSDQIQNIVLVHSVSAYYGIPYCLQNCIDVKYWPMYLNVYIYCILTASGNVALCKRLQPFTESDVTRCRKNTIGPHEDGHVNARNMSRIVV
jgi:hypothetical protein